MRFLTRPEQSAYLKATYNLTYSPKTLTKLASTGGGPQYQLFGNKAVSTCEQLDEWVREKLSAPRRSTSEAA
jgi:hypothetical protein